MQIWVNTFHSILTFYLHFKLWSCYSKKAEEKYHACDKVVGYNLYPEEQFPYGYMIHCAAFRKSLSLIDTHTYKTTMFFQQLPVILLIP